jgi:M6 family metalloprotease-like protein
MKKIFLTILAALCCYGLFAVPARRGFITHTQPDGSVIKIQKFGDEFFHWTTDASGRVVEKDADGYYRPVSESQLNARRAAAAIRRTAANRARRSPAKAGIASGQKHFLVILVQFSDLSFQSSTANADFTALLNEPGYNVNGGTGSARDFYYDNSGGLFDPVFDVYGPVTLSNTKAYYGGNNSNGDDNAPEKAVQQACQSLDSQVNFTQFDNDSDGEVDLVFMYYAGYGEADSDDEDAIWPHQWELTSGGISLTLDGKKIDKYACTNEREGDSGNMCGIGTACHEFGHAMGLPDFYDTDYTTNGQSAGMFFFSTMDSGSYNNDGKTPPYFTIEERIMLGWIDESAFREFSQSGSYTIPSVNNNIAYKTPTDMNGEYFVYECRGNSGWDAGLPSGANGLVVTHVDKSSRSVKISGGTSSASELWSNWTANNSINENGKHPCCYVIPAPDQSNLLYGHTLYQGNYYFSSSYSAKIPFPGSQGITSYTASSWNGVNSAVQLSNIAYSNNQVTLYATVPSSTLNYNVIYNPGNGIYTAGGSFTPELEVSDAQPVSSVQWYIDDEPLGSAVTVSPFTGQTVTLTAGTHVIEAHMTLQSGGTKILELTVTAQ